MMDEFIWLQKTDPVYKHYIEKNWFRILAVKNELSETYYCFCKNGNEKSEISEELRNMLIAPISVKEKNFDNFIMTFEENKTFAFIWQNQRCFSTPYEVVEKIKKSPLNFYRPSELIEVPNVRVFLSKSKLKIKTTIDIMPIFLIFLCILLVCLTVIGLLIWLF